MQLTRSLLCCVKGLAAAACCRRARKRRETRSDIPGTAVAGLDARELGDDTGAALTAAQAQMTACLRGTTLQLALFGLLAQLINANTEHLTPAVRRHAYG